MTFLVSVLWALLTFGNVGFSHIAPSGAGYAPAATAPVHGFHAKGGMRPMDTNGGGPTAPAPAPSPASST